MTEINTEYERLAMPGIRSTAKARSAGQPPDNDGGLLHDYGPNVQIRRAQPSEIGGLPFAAMPVPKGSTAALSLTEKLGLSAFTLRRSAKYRAAKAQRPRDGEDWDLHGCAPEAAPSRDALQAIGATSPSAKADPAERGAGDAFLAGSVAVGIIIVNGPTAATRFTGAERVKVVAEVQAGLTWLGNQDPASGVSWHYEINNLSISTSTTATAADDESRWRNGSTRPDAELAGRAELRERPAHAAGYALGLLHLFCQRLSAVALCLCQRAAHRDGLCQRRLGAGECRPGAGP